MVTISHVVQDVLKRQVLIQEAINHGIVSYNKLAQMLKPQIEQELGREVKHSAVVMALRRTSGKFKKAATRPVFSYSIETIKTDICYIVLEESPTLLSQLEHLYRIIDFKKGGILNIIQGNYEVAIIINHRYKEKVLDILSEEKVLDTVDELVSISLTYSKNFLFTPGILYDVSRFLAWENINAIDIILTKTELSLIIDKKDLMRCYKTLGRFAENSAEGEKDIKEIVN
jgi:hypothetical protein